MRFPIFALIAPLLASVVLWAVTGSAYTLLFALLGPVMALAQFADGKLHTRRSLRERESEREEEEVRAVVQESHLREEDRQQQLRLYPPASTYCMGDTQFRPLWAAGELFSGEERIVRLGLGVGKASPYLLDLSAGLAIRGDEVEVASVLRALATHLSWKWGAAEGFRVEQDVSSQPEWKVLDVALADRLSTLVFRVAEGGHLPSGVRYLLTVDSGRGELVDTTAQASIEQPNTHIDLDFLTRAQAQPIIGILRQEVEALHAPQRSALPQKVIARLVETEAYQSCRTSLVVCVGEQETQPLFLDLVSSGPHAVVTGMTGSGKTEFLRAWLMALCCSYPADELSLLIVDFKGGAGFQDFEELPHVAGIVTDLNAHEVHRAVMSLHAEVLFREKVLVDQRVTDIRELPRTGELSRLIVVVDEYRALLERFPEFAQLFIDLTSRGRALGIHVVLSSQQVGVAMGDALLANCALRMSFRVAHKQDSLALLGSDAAYTLDHTPGRGVLMGTGIALREFQAPLPRVVDFELVRTRAKRWESENPHWIPRKPWLAPLPSRILIDGAPQNVEGVAWLGLADLPEHQAQSWVLYNPARDGNLLVTGPARSGVSSALQLLAEQFRVDVFTDAERAWDAVVEEAGHDAQVLIIDNLEAIVDEFTHEHREEFIRCLSARARELPRTGRALISTWSSSALAHSWLSKLFSSELTLHSARMQGRASWDGHDVQLVASSVISEHVVPVPYVECEEGCEYLIITRRLHTVRDALVSRYPNRVTMVDSVLTVIPGAGGILIGTPDAWLARQVLLQEKLDHAVLVIDSCSPSELRSLRLRPELFPHVELGKVLVVEPDGRASRSILKN